MIAGCFGVVTGHIFARKGVDLCAQRVERIGNFECGVRRRSLELHMFEEVGNSVLSIRFKRRADKHPHRYRKQPFHPFDNHSYAVFQRLCFRHTFLLYVKKPFGS